MPCDNATADLRIDGHDEKVVLKHAIDDGWVVLTHNCDFFQTPFMP
jgi:hypothetical protein